MYTNVNDFCEDLDDSTITNVNADESTLTVDLQLWNEDTGKLTFKDVIAHEKPSTDRIDYIRKKSEGTYLKDSLDKTSVDTSDTHEYSLFALSNNDEEIIFQVVAKSILFERW